ncbi:pentapeptide repeat-containing protein [Streptomyces sp. NPDC000070]|uniref:pentapeptide repeat-containing protein n=1 Tax=Streptomyces sp. NPDC000070 TaxID=3154240 RepID=UPI0033182F2C
MTKESQITDRYTAAVTNLGDDSVDVRLGGIYALQRIMQDSPRDHPTIANVLAAYIRTHARKHSVKDRALPADIRAALTVLVDRDPRKDKQFRIDLANSWLPGAELLSSYNREAPLAWADLRGSHLVGADLADADLASAELTDSNLRNAHLRNADLTMARLGEADLRGTDLRGTDIWGALLGGADLRKADLTSARLANANLTKSDLSGTNLLNTRLTNADLTGAKLIGANLHDADLRGANLRGTIGLEVQDLLVAGIDSCTKLPTDLAKLPAAQARIAEIERSIHQMGRAWPKGHPKCPSPP